MKTVAVVFGARPEAMKLAPVERLLRPTPGPSCRVCVTAQHREMLDQVIQAFDIEVERLISNPDVRAARMAAANPFEDGKAAQRIADSIDR